MNTTTNILRSGASAHTYYFRTSFAGEAKSTTGSSLLPDAVSAPQDSSQTATDNSQLSQNGSQTSNAQNASSASSQTTQTDSLELSFLLPAEDSERSLLTQASEKDGSGSDEKFKINSSVPSDSVGQLASELARAESRIDVLQVSSKATRALLNLKMSAANAEGDDAKKITQMIRRYKKLVKRIQKKLQHLSQEEQLETRRKRAMKQLNFEKEAQIREELKERRSKRHKDEKNYATKQINEDGKNNASEIAAAMAGNMSAAGMDASMSDAIAFAMGGGMDLGSMGADAVSFDALA